MAGRYIFVCTHCGTSRIYGSSRNLVDRPEPAEALIRCEYCAKPTPHVFASFQHALDRSFLGDRYLGKNN